MAHRGIYYMQPVGDWNSLRLHDSIKVTLELFVVSSWKHQGTK